MTKISLVRTDNRMVGVRHALDLLKLNPVSGKAVVLKPNFNTADPAPGSTHTDTLRSLLLTLKDMKARKITLAERSGPYDTTHNIMEKKGIFALSRELGFDVINLQEMDQNGWVLIKPSQSHWENGFLFPRVYKEAESIVLTCCLKTHAYGGHFTLSLKCAVGMVPPERRETGEYSYMKEMHSSRYTRQMIAEINTAFSPALIVLDGVEAFVEGGPATGKKVPANVILAGTDRVAIDAVGVAVLRYLGTTPEVTQGKIFDQEQIKRAVELGLGVTSAGQIELVTDDKESKSYASNIKKILTKG